MIISHIISTQLYLRCLPFHFSQLAGYSTGAITSLGKSKKLKGKASATVEKVRLPVETDTKKLAKYLCGSNLLAEGGQDIELKPDDEYPEWVWNLYLGRNRSISELDPNTFDYWNKVRALAIRQNHRLKKLKKY